MSIDPKFYWLVKPDFAALSAGVIVLLILIIRMARCSREGNHIAHITNARYIAH
jgi:hypothetical protein